MDYLAILGLSSMVQAVVLFLFLGGGTAQESSVNLLWVSEQIWRLNAHLLSRSIMGLDLAKNLGGWPVLNAASSINYTTQFPFSITFIDENGNPIIFFRPFIGKQDHLMADRRSLWKCCHPIINMQQPCIIPSAHD